MRENQQVTALLTATVLFGALVVGCAPEAAGDDDVLVLAMTAGANEPAPALTARARQEITAALQGDHASLRVVVAGDQRPRVVEEGQLRLRRGAQVEHDGARRAALTRQEVERVGALLAGTGSGASQSDPLALLDHIGRTPGRVTGVLLSSGLQTTGPLATAVLGWDRVGAGATVEHARSLGLVPDLTGKRVVFSGIGDTEAPQRPLPPQLRNRLVDFWTGLCRAGGAVECAVDPDPVTGGRPVSTTPVPTVPVPEPPVVSEPVPQARPIALSSDVLFGPDSAVLLEPAGPVLRGLAANLPAGAGITLTGHTASVGPADTARRLSLARATAVRDALVGLGVPGSAVTALGVGFDEPIAVDRGPDGALDPVAAQRNRAVVVVVTAGGGRS